MRRLRWRDATADRLFVPSTIVALMPLVVATVRAIQRDWLPIGDNAYFAIRATDVFSDNRPLLGTWTSNSLSSGINANNPGPLFFDLLAVPARLFPGGPGVAAGVALINGLAVVAIAVMTRRRAGSLVAMVATATAAALCWAMGSELLFEPWQPHAMLLPFLAFLVLTWCASAGDLVALPLTVLVGSLLVQTHLSYALMVPAAMALGLVGFALDLRHRRSHEGDAWPRRRRRAIVAAATTAIVGALCWVQPLIEQFTSAGDGNLTRLAHTFGEAPEQTIGYGRAVQLLASVTVLPPWWVRPSFGRAWLPAAPDTVIIELDDAVLPGIGLAVVAMVLVAIGLTWCFRDRFADRDRVGWTLPITAAVALLGGLVTAGQAPVGVLGLTPHHLRWMWPLAAFTFFAVVASLLRRLGPAKTSRGAVAGAVLCAIVVVAGLNTATYHERVGPSHDDFAIPVMRDIASQMGVLEGHGTLLFDLRGEAFASPYSAPIMAELQRRDIPFVIDDPGMVRQLGSARRFTGANASAVLLYRVGAAADVAPAGSLRVAMHSPLSRAEGRELVALRGRLAAHIRDRGGLTLNDRGRAAVRRGELPQMARQTETSVLEPEALLSSHEVVLMVQRALVVIDEVWSPRFERYTDLQNRSDAETVALFLRPLPSRDQLEDPP